MSPGETNDAALASVQELSRLANDVDPTDLSGLAKMHGVCEQLIEAATASGADSMASSLEELASKLGKTLEGLILGEADPPGEAMELVRHCVAGMEAVTQGGDIPDSSAGDAPVLTDAEVASKLDDLFADDATTAESPDAVQEATPAPADVPPLPTAPTVASADVPTPAAVAEIATPATDIPAYVQEDLYVKESELEFVKGFVEEAYEHIESIETAVLEVERDSTDAAKIDTLFRPFHTIKGMAGFLNLRDINCVTHEAETLLDQGRKGKREITSGMIDLIFEVVDILKAQMSSVATWLNNPTPDPIEQPPVSEMIAYLRSVVAGHVEPQGTGPDAIAPSNRIGDNLVIQGACESESVDGAVDAQQRGLTDKPTGEILMEKGVVSAKQVAHALRPQAQAQKTTTTQAGGAGIGDHSVRIDTAKLDALVDMVGELVIAQTLVSSDPGVATDEKLAKNVGQVTKIVRDVQETAMAMRMVPIGPTTFQKMARLVRDVSRKAGKQVDLTITGEETELDKNVIQQINDPLVHMVRNAVDHGVEPPHERIEAGKPEIGKVHLGAYHQGGDIVIEISDDGRGLDAKKLIEKGIEKGIVRPDEELTDNQAFNLVFAPGFSTAKEVTDISGRGVGMDVVKRNIEQLRGKVDITSEVGRGSTFAIRLPLTLAIIDGMIVRIGTERFIIQTIVIEQSLRPQRHQVTTVQNKGELLNVRGRLVPLIQLGQLFGLTPRVDPCEAMVVIAQCDGVPVGLIVEELIGQQQVVIKSLGEKFEKLRGISGAAILGDGRVGLILEMSGLAVENGAACLGSINARSPNGTSPASDTESPEPDHDSTDETVAETQECPALA